MAGLAVEALQTPLNEEQHFFFSDAIPEVCEARVKAAEYAQQVLSQNRQKVIEGEVDTVPLPVDVLGTARRVVEAENSHGRSSEVRSRLFEGLLLDCARVYAEAYRAKSWEYFAPSRQIR